MNYNKLVKELRKKAEKLRFEVTSFEEFFEKYIGLISSVKGVKVEYDLLSRKYKMHSATHESPIGYRCAWSKEEREDPNIPRVHKVVEYEVHYNLEIDTEKIETKEIFLDLFSGSHLFWAFGDIRPGYVHCDINSSRGSSYKVYLFIEDFPKIFPKHRKEIVIKRLQDKYDESVKLYNEELKQYQKVMIASDPELSEISEMRTSLNKMINAIRSIEIERKNHITTAATAEFRKNNPIPEPEDIFVSTEEFIFPEPTDAAETTKRFIDLKKEFEQYKKDYPMDLI